MKSKKKILIFIDWFLPGYIAGGPIQSCANLVAHLEDEFDFSIVTRDTDYCDTIPYPNIIANEWNYHSKGARVYYISKDKLYRKTIKQLILSEDFDIVYLNGLYSLYFTLIPLYYLKRVFSLRLAFKSSEKKVMVATRGMLSEGAVSVKGRKKKLFIRSSRIIGLFNNVVFHATSSQEADDIKNHFGSQAKIKTASNLPKKITANIDKIKIKEKGKVRLINIARIAPEKGLLYALEILRNVKAKVDFDIYGPVYNEKYWKLCQKIIHQLNDNIHVTYKGSIPGEKIQEILSNYHFMLMPTKGENFGHVIFESMSAGCPVIISDKTPWNNLMEQQAGWDISLLEPSNFVEAVEQCCRMDNEEYKKWSAGAMVFVKDFLIKNEIFEHNRQLFL